MILKILDDRLQLYGALTSGHFMNTRQDGALPNVSPRRRTSLTCERIGAGMLSGSQRPEEGSDRAYGTAGIDVDHVTSLQPADAGTRAESNGARAVADDLHVVEGMAAIAQLEVTQHGAHELPRSSFPQIRVLSESDR